MKYPVTCLTLRTAGHTSLLPSSTWQTQEGISFGQGPLWFESRTNVRACVAIDIATGKSLSTVFLTKDVGGLFNLLSFSMCMLMLQTARANQTFFSVYRFTLLIYNSLPEHIRGGSVVNCVLVNYLVKPCFILSKCLRSSQIQFCGLILSFENGFVIQGLQLMMF